MSDRVGGIYEFEITPPLAGFYEFYLKCPSLDLGFEGPWRLRIEARPPAESTGGDDGD